MFAIGNNELDLLMPAGKHAKCPHCGKRKVIRFGERVLPNGKKEPSDMLGFVNCGKEAYLVSIKGKLI